MSVRWERLAGDTSSFAVKIAFADDPHQGAGADADVARSWGALQIWVDGVNISSYSDDGRTLDASFWYLLPVLEWLTQNWDPLLHEERLPLSADAEDAASVVRPWSETTGYDTAVMGHVEEDWEWRARHALRTARDGGIFPGVFIRRHRSQVELSWADVPLAGASEVRHLAPFGRSYVAPELIADPLHTVATEAARWLLTQRPASPRLEALVTGLEALVQGPDEPRLAWLAGLGTSTQEAVDRWRHVQKKLAGTFAENSLRDVIAPRTTDPGLVIAGSPVATLLFGSVSPYIDDEDVIELMRLVVQREPADGSALRTVAEEVQLSNTPQVWQQGYDLALAALDDLWDEDGPLDVDGVLRDLGIDVIDIELSDERLRAVSLAGGDRTPMVAVNLNCPYNQVPWSRRFTLAHEFCHLLHDQAYGADLAIASGPWAPAGLERRANAFAAMLLMPPQLVSKAETDVGLSLAIDQGVEAVAGRLGVSRIALVEHAVNIGLLNREARYRLMPRG